MMHYIIGYQAAACMPRVYQFVSFCSRQQCICTLKCSLALSGLTHSYSQILHSIHLPALDAAPPYWATSSALRAALSAPIRSVIAAGFDAQLHMELHTPNARMQLAWQGHLHGTASVHMSLSWAELVPFGPAVLSTDSDESYMC